VIALKPDFVCHVRHAQKRPTLSHIQTMTSAKGPKPLVFALHVMDCHGMSVNVMVRLGVLVILCSRFGSTPSLFAISLDS
jgi:hypothetical protein